MAKIIKDKNGRVIFTKEMKKEYTLLIPNMLPFHFRLLRSTLRRKGYKADLLINHSKNIINEGLKNVHNDACYPALIVIGQMIDAIKNGKYDPDKVALVITQTGGGCRASNYIHLLRKALSRSGYGQVPVVSVSMGTMEKNPGFKMSVGLLKEFLYDIMYGDMIMAISNCTEPYEVNKGDCEKLKAKWAAILKEQFKHKKNITRKKMQQNFALIVEDFHNIQCNRVPKVKVGIVGEIYVKFAPVANNFLEDFLKSEGVEVCVPGLTDFLLYCMENTIYDRVLYGGNIIKDFIFKKIKAFVINLQNDMINALQKYDCFSIPSTFEETRIAASKYIDLGTKMGEGWLLTGEMIELINKGYNNIICAQPFGCLPNHIVGRGMMKQIKERNPQANLVAIDYDPGSSEINQQNRIKLMLMSAQKNLDYQLNKDN